MIDYGLARFCGSSWDVLFCTLERKSQRAVRGYTSALYSGFTRKFGRLYRQEFLHSRL